MSTTLRQVRLEAQESVEGWHVRLVLTQHDEEGYLGEPGVFVTVDGVQSVDDVLEQAWHVLDHACRIVASAASSTVVPESDSYHETF